MGSASMKLTGLKGWILTFETSPLAACLASTPMSPNTMCALAASGLESPKAAAIASSSKPVTRPVLISRVSTFTTYFPSTGEARSRSDFTTPRREDEEPCPFTDLSFPNASSKSLKVSAASKSACSFFSPRSSCATSPRSPCLR